MKNIKILKTGINVSKIRKQLEKLTLDELPVSTRKYPHILFKPEREAMLMDISSLHKEMQIKLVFPQVLSEKFY